MAARDRNRGGSKLGGPASVPDLQNTPLPSALDGRRYEIRDSGGTGRPAFVGRSRDGEGVMQVPLGPELAARRTRLHEMAHVRWTPAAPDLPAIVSHETINAVEDCRITKRLREIDLDAAAAVPIVKETTWSKWTDDFYRQADPDEHVRPWPPLEVARMLTATIGTYEEERFRLLIEQHGHGWVAPLVDDMVRRHMGGRRPAFRRAVEIAEEMETTFAELDDLIDGETQGRMRDAAHEDDGAGNDSWGAMEILEMPLSVRLPRGLRTKVRRATDSGAVPRHWHRVPIDGRVFSVRRYRPQGGTLLLDQSGSMSLDTAEVQAIMAAFPAVTIATYAGDDSHGSLRIIARNGVRASDADCLHPQGGNCVDGPALEWLATMPEPRLWVSDGEVVGAGNRQTPWHFLDAARICKRGKIVRVDRLDALVPAGGAA